MKKRKCELKCKLFNLFTLFIRRFRASHFECNASDDGLQRLSKIYQGSMSEALTAAGSKPVLLLTYLLHSLAYDEWVTFWKFFRARFYPLLVGFVNLFEMVML